MRSLVIVVFFVWAHSVNAQESVRILPESSKQTNPPTVQTNNPLTVNEGDSGLIDDSKLVATDLDNPDSQIFWTLRSGGGPSDGSMILDGTTASWVRQSDISAGLVSYIHGGGEDPSDSLGFELTDTNNCCVDALGSGCSDSIIEGCVCALDSYCCDTRWDSTCVDYVSSPCSYSCGATAGEQNFSINVLPINDPPIVQTNSSLTVAEGNYGVINTSRLVATDVDNPANEIIWTIRDNGDASHGYLALNGQAAFWITQANINTHMVRYYHDGSELPSDSITFIVTDNHNCCVVGVGFGCSDPTIEACVCAGHPSCCSERWSSNCADQVIDTCAAVCGASAGSQDFNINIAPVNDDPVLTTNRVLAVNQGEQSIITPGFLETVDPDHDPTDLIYTIYSGPSSGEVQIEGTYTTTFTQEQVNSNDVSYLHTGPSTTSDYFTFRVVDGAAATIGPFLFNITIQEPIFADGFETGNLTDWSSSSP